MCSVELNGMSSRQLQISSGAGSPLTSTLHLCVRPALIVTLLNVLRSILGLTEKVFDHERIHVLVTQNLH